MHKHYAEHPHALTAEFRQAGYGQDQTYINAYWQTRRERVGRVNFLDLYRLVIYS